MLWLLGVSGGFYIFVTDTLGLGLRCGTVCPTGNVPGSGGWGAGWGGGVAGGVAGARAGAPAPSRAPLAPSRPQPPACPENGPTATTTTTPGRQTRTRTEVSLPPSHAPRHPLAGRPPPPQGSCPPAPRARLFPRRARVPHRSPSPSVSVTKI